MCDLKIIFLPPADALSVCYSPLPITAGHWPSPLAPLYRRRRPLLHLDIPHLFAFVGVYFVFRGLYFEGTRYVVYHPLNLAVFKIRTTQDIASLVLCVVTVITIPKYLFSVSFCLPRVVPL